MKGIEHRPRQSGKLNEMALQVAERCGLQHATVMDLLHKGWQYTERLGEPTRWEQMR